MLILDYQVEVKINILKNQVNGYIIKMEIINIKKII